VLATQFTTPHHYLTTYQATLLFNDGHTTYPATRLYINDGHTIPATHHITQLHNYTNKQTSGNNKA